MRRKSRLWSLALATVWLPGDSGDCLHRVYNTIFQEEVAGCEGKDGAGYVAVRVIDCLLKDWLDCFFESEIWSDSLLQESR